MVILFVAVLAVVLAYESVGLAADVCEVPSENIIEFNTVNVLLVSEVNAVAGVLYHAPLEALYVYAMPFSSVT
jgi:hypothetical protein